MVHPQTHRSSPRGRLSTKLVFVNYPQVSHVYHFFLSERKGDIPFTKGRFCEHRNQFKPKDPEVVEKILDMNPEASAGDFGGERRITARMRGYQQLNLVSGAAGTGKTTGFLRAFENDERIDDVLMCCPLGDG